MGLQVTRVTAGGGGWVQGWVIDKLHFGVLSMTRSNILIIAAFLIVTASMVPSAREHGVRLPQCWRMLQVQKHAADLVRVSLPVAGARISVAG